MHVSKELVNKLYPLELLDTYLNVEKIKFGLNTLKNNVTNTKSKTLSYKACQLLEKVPFNFFNNMPEQDYLNKEAAS